MLCFETTYDGKKSVVANSDLGPTMMSMQCRAADIALVYGTKLTRERYQFLHSVLLHTLTMSDLPEMELIIRANFTHLLGCGCHGF